MANLLQVTLSLGLVVAVIAGAAWLAQRLRQPQHGQRALIRVQAAASVGTRERVVLLEVAGQWLLVGVAPGRVNTLLHLPGPPEPASPESHAPAGAASWLNTYLNKLNDR
jgi:flagellar protein FliO/FliZ